MGLVVLFIGIPLLYVRKIGLESRERPVWLRAVGMFLLIINTLLVSAIGAGAGSPQVVIMMYFFGFTALVASAVKRAMHLLSTTASLIIFISAALVDYRVGVVALVTSLAGGFIGAHIAIKKGNKFVINLFAIVSILLALQLLFGSS